MLKHFFRQSAPLALGLLFTFAAASLPAADDTNAAVSPGDSGASLVEAAVISNQSTIRANVQIQEQLHDLKAADERSRMENAAAAQKLTDLVSHRLDMIEGSLTSQGLQKLDDMRQATLDAQHSNQMMLMSAVGVACFGCLVLVLAAFLQWQTVNRVRALTAGLNTATVRPMIGAGESAALSSGALEQSTAQFLGAIERLERRIHQIEDHSHHNGKSLEAGATANGGALVAAGENGIDLAAESALPDEARHLEVLLNKGQTLLKLDQAEPALQCFEEILAESPNHSEALLARGSALERLQRLNEAIESYDRAIASDRRMTMAYLHKGGVFNRLERYTEALECYELALKCQEKAAIGEVIAAA